MRTKTPMSRTGGGHPAHRGALQGRLGPTVLKAVGDTGAAVVRNAIPSSVCRKLVDEAEAVSGRYLALPSPVNGVHQRAEQLAVRVGDPSHPALHHLVARVRRALASEPGGTGVECFDPNEARFMRYAGAAAGVGVHRDGKCYALLVCIFTLAGTAPFAVVDDDGRRVLDVLVHAGDLVLLRAPGFAGGADGRPRHTVGQPLAGPRVSLTLRMVRGSPRPASGPSRSRSGVAP